MGIAKSLRKAGNLREFSIGLGSVLDKLIGDKSMDDLIKTVTDVGKQVEGRFQPQPNQTKADMIGNQVNDPFLQQPGRNEAALKNIGLQPENKLDPEAGQKSYGDIADFIISQLGKGNDPGTMNSAVTGLEMKRESLMPGETKETKGVSHDPYKELIDPVTGAVIKPAKEKPVKEGEKFKNFSAKGYWSLEDPENPKWVANPNYKSDAAGKDDEYGDPSKPLGKINMAIAKIKAIKNAKWDDNTKTFRIPDPFGIGYFEGSQQEVTELKEQVKRTYQGETTTLIKSQGLQDAVGDIGELLDVDPKTGQSRVRSMKNVESAIDKFMEFNPEFTEDHRDMLRDYFIFFLL